VYGHPANKELVLPYRVVWNFAGSDIEGSSAALPHLRSFQEPLGIATDRDDDGHWPPVTVVNRR
jgi:hypothetical protein